MYHFSSFEGERSKIMADFELAIKFALQTLTLQDIKMKNAAMRAVKAVSGEKKDVLAVLPTGLGYEKSLIYQILPSVFDYFECGQTPSKPNSMVIVQRKT